MKATTLPPEHAALVAAKVQTIITFARKPKVTAGDRLAIHAGTRLSAPVWEWIGPYELRATPGGLYGLRRDAHRLRLHPGHIVASCVVRDVVPIVAGNASDDWLPPQLIADEHGLLLTGPLLTDRRNATDQLPLADFTPGRWAVLLDQVAATTDRCPACWGKRDRIQHVQNRGLWGACITCDADGTCPPIPRRGRPGIWEVTW